MKKELIYTDRSGQTNFQKEVNQVMLKTNDLIRIFNENQPFTEVKTRNQAESLLMSAISFYDTVILQNIKLPKNNLEVNILKLCELYSVPRAEFLKAIGLTPDQVSGCDTCNSSKTIKLKGENIISFSLYNTYCKYLTWENGFFDLDNSAIEVKNESFIIYAENEIQLKYYNHFQSLARVLNSHIEIAKLGTDQVNNLATATGLLKLNNKLIIDSMKLSQTIKYMN